MSDTEKLLAAKMIQQDRLAVLFRAVETKRTELRHAEDDLQRWMSELAMTSERELAEAATERVA